MTDMSHSIFHYAPQVSLTFIIVGGGFAGLSAAFVLCKAGHKCIVLESSSSMRTSHGPLSIASNLAKIFGRWGILEALEPRCCKPTGVEYFSYRSGEHLRTWTWKEVVYEATGFHYHLTDQMELQSLLFNMATASGAEIRFGCRVQTLDPAEPSVTLEDGRVIRGDIIIGADGNRSLVREYVLGYKDPGVPTGLTVFATTVPLPKMLEDEDLAPLIEATAISKWLGPSKIILGLPVKDLGIYCLYLIHDTRNSDGSLGIRDETENIGDRIRELVSDWEPRVKKIASLVTDGYFFEEVKRGSYDSWVHESNHLVLIGDACHSMPEYAVQRCAMIIEDAAVLGDLFSRIEGSENIPFVLNAYQELRQTRCAAVQAWEQNAQNCLRIREGTPDDLEERGKELMEAYMKQEADPDRIAEIWDGLAQMILYEVELEVDQWWADFGQLMSPTSPAANRVTSFMDINVSYSTETMHHLPRESVKDLGSTLEKVKVGEMLDTDTRIVVEENSANSNPIVD